MTGSDANVDPSIAPAGPDGDRPDDEAGDPPDGRPPIGMVDLSPLDRWRSALTAGQLERPGGQARAIGVGLAVLVVVLVGTVALSRITAAPDRAPVVVSSGAATSAPSVPSEPAPSPPATASPSVVVAVAGGVTTPGVYRLVAGGRVADAVALAGGLTTDADADRLNLAAPLRDGDRVYVPRRGEDDVPTVVDPDGGASGGGDATATTRPEPIDINRASVDQLDALPGVGPSTAAAIVEYRSQHGPFRSLDDVSQVRGIGPAKLAQLRPLIRL